MGLRGLSISYDETASVGWGQASRSMDDPKVLVIATNLFFLPRIRNVAEPHGCDTRQVMNVDRLHDELDEGTPVLVLVDLEADHDFWKQAVKTVLAVGTPRPQIVGYGGHTNVPMLQKAEAVGCDLVLTKGQFSRDLGKLIAEAAGEVAETSS